MNKKVKLLIITQKVDENDDILGFMHGWIREFAKHCEQVTVICLYKGEHHLPKNVKVLSLGKEEGGSRAAKPFRYIARFYKHIWNERKNYDNVFVHMNQEYVLLGWKFWKLWNKKIFLWRNHAKGNFATRLAVFFSNKVFCTSKQSFTARFKKAKIMPVGIDTDFFKPDSSIHKNPNSILFLGRIAPVKNVDMFIESLKELQKQGVKFIATIAGTSLPKDTAYKKTIHDKVLSYGLGNKIIFTGAVSQKDALKLYREHEIYVNLTPSGSMDKTIFEAMACEVVPLVYNEDLKEVLGEEFILMGLGTNHVVDKMSKVLRKKKSRNFRDMCVNGHNLNKLIGMLFREIR